MAQVGDTCRDTTQHAYHLCEELLGVIAVVIFQDGNVRFVKCKNGIVAHWDLA